MSSRRRLRKRAEPCSRGRDPARSEGRGRMAKCDQGLWVDRPVWQSSFKAVLRANRHSCLQLRLRTTTWGRHRRNAHDAERCLQSRRHGEVPRPKMVIGPGSNGILGHMHPVLSTPAPREKGGKRELLQTEANAHHVPGEPPCWPRAPASPISSNSQKTSDPKNARRRCVARALTNKPRCGLARPDRESEFQRRTDIRQGLPVSLSFRSQSSTKSTKLFRTTLFSSLSPLR